MFFVFELSKNSYLGHEINWKSKRGGVTLTYGKFFKQIMFRIECRLKL